MACTACFDAADGALIHCKCKIHRACLARVSRMISWTIWIECVVCLAGPDRAPRGWLVQVPALPDAAGWNARPAGPAQSNGGLGPANL